MLSLSGLLSAIPSRHQPAVFTWLPRCAAFALVLLLLCLALPAMLTLLLSLQQSGDATPFASGFGLAAWASAVSDGDLLAIFARSLLTALALAAIASLLAIAPAYLAAVSGRHPLGRLMLFLCILVPLADQVVTVIGWSEIGRLLTRLMEGTGHAAAPMPTSTTSSLSGAAVAPGAGGRTFGTTLTLLAELHRLLPLAILCQWAAMRRVDRSLIETALECGATHRRILREIVLPQARCGIALGLLAIAIAAIGAFLEPALLGSGSILSLGERLQKALEIDSNWPLGAIIALIMLVVAMLGIWLIGIDWRHLSPRTFASRFARPAMPNSPVTPGLDQGVHGNNNRVAIPPSPQPSPAPPTNVGLRRQGGEGGNASAMFIPPHPRNRILALCFALAFRWRRNHAVTSPAASTPSRLWGKSRFAAADTESSSWLPHASSASTPSPLAGEGWGEGAGATNTLSPTILSHTLLTPRAGLFWAAIFAAAFLAAPLLWMAVLSLRYGVGIAEAAGPRLFWRAVTLDPVLLPALGNTLMTSLLAALFACLAGAGLASLWQVWLQRRGSLQRRGLLQGHGSSQGRAWRLVLLTALPLLLPAIALSTLHLAAHLFFAAWLPGGLGFFAVLPAEALRATPLAALLIAFAWAQAPHHLTATVVEFGLEQRRAWTQLVAPFIRPAYAAAFAACFLLSAGDFQLGNALSGEMPLLSPALLTGIATQRSPIYMALVLPILALTAALSWLILARLGARPLLPQTGAVGAGAAATGTTPPNTTPTKKKITRFVTITSSPASKRP